MKLAFLTCGKCRKDYEGVVHNPNQYYAPCPDCGQFNILDVHTHNWADITGICTNCNVPLDDHIWQGTVPAHCP
jgi:hypothetical protein